MEAGFRFLGSQCCNVSNLLVRYSDASSSSHLALLVSHFQASTEPETLKTGILVLVPLPTFRGPTSQSKMSGYEKFPHPTSHFSFPISLIRSIAQNSWNILNTTVYGALGTSSNGPISHFMREVWCEKWEVGIVNAFIPFLTWHLRSGKWDSNEDSRF